MHKFLFSVFLVLFTFVSCNQADLNEARPLSQESYILYGTPDTSQAHQAVVYITNETRQGYGACTGTLISSDVVLTAGHCVGDPSAMAVYFGNSMSGFYAQRNVSEVERHPNYSTVETSISNDIALIRMSSAAPSSITPIPPLPASAGLTNADVDTTPLQYVGFGLTETGSSGTKLTMTKPADVICGGSAACNYNVSGMGYVQLSPGTLGIEMDYDGGICSGDSGGPAFVTRNNTEYVAGVSSWVLQDQSGNCAYFGVSTKVDYFTSFINDYLGTISEVCTNGTDDDSDGLVDCEDTDCYSHPDCQTTACDEIINIGCGDSLNEYSGGTNTVFSTYGSCGGGADGSELVYRVNTSAGAEIIATLRMDTGSADLQMYLLEGACDPSSCTDSSTNPAGQVEQLVFTKSNSELYLVVDAADSVNSDFSLSLDCNNNEPVEECSNGNDEDDDGLVDCEDADCILTNECLNRIEICDNGTDDDGDLKADCEDIDCASFSACGIDSEICNNGIDDTGNGKIDCNDPVCRTSRFCPIMVEDCINSYDDDGDGRVDCADPDCHSFAGCPTPQGEICYNGSDDDGDGLADCEDDDCNRYYYCSIQNWDNNLPVIHNSDPGNDDPDCSCHYAGKNTSLPSIFVLFIIVGFAAFYRRFSALRAG
ncbi:MAG: S1 family peptidase [Deltaproteobacteria bacterium]|jgi:secreted trypsin-like serine protease|nr:S1 family peptidase [Deltaproteobacteria bacterium]